MCDYEPFVMAKYSFSLSDNRQASIKSIPIESTFMAWKRIQVYRDAALELNKNSRMLIAFDISSTDQNWSKPMIFSPHSEFIRVLL